jgi:hypothetical protein
VLLLDWEHGNGFSVTSVELYGGRVVTLNVRVRKDDLASGEVISLAGNRKC